MTQTGVVREVFPDGSASVLVRMRTACGHSCEDCGGCASAREIMIRARNRADARQGDEVTLSTGTKRVIGAAALVYCLPLGLMLLAALGCALLGGGEKLCALSAVLALCLGAALAAVLGRAGHRRLPMEYDIIGLAPETAER